MGSTVHLIADLQSELKLSRSMWGHFVLEYDGNFHHFWDSLIFLFLVYTAFFYPVELAFFWMHDIPLACKRLNEFVDIVFFLDILISFMTAYMDEELFIVRDPKKIAKNYLKTWFIIDFISAIPYE